MTASRARRPVLPALTALLVGAVVAGGATLFNGSTASTADDSRLSVGLAGAAKPGFERPAPATKNETTTTPIPPTTTTTTPTTTTTTTATTTTTTPPPPPSPSTTTRPPTAQDTSAQAQVLALANDFRAQAGCAPLTADAQLADAAQKHASDMANRDYFSHDTPEGVTFDKRIRNAGYPRPGAENLAKGARTAEQVMDMWMNSDGHRRNILNCDLTALGVGLDQNGFYWVQDFGY